MVLSGVEADDEASQGEALLADARRVFDSRGADRLSTKMLLDDLARLDGRPWAEASKGRPLTSHHLGRLLRGFKIRPGTIRVADDATPKGYVRGDFEDAWARYLPLPARVALEANVCAPRAIPDLRGPLRAMKQVHCRCHALREAASRLGVSDDGRIG